MRGASGRTCSALEGLLTRRTAQFASSAVLLTLSTFYLTRRAWNTRLIVGPEGVEVANFFRRRTLLWSEITLVDLGRARRDIGYLGPTAPALRFHLGNGKIV